MDLIDKINSSQRREVIDEDKKISKRALDSEFAFIQRIGQESLPSTGLDKSISYRIKVLLGQLRNYLEDSYTTVLEEIQQLRKKEANVDDEVEILITYVDAGKSVQLWNNIINLIKNYSMSEKDINDFWSIVDQEITPALEQLLFTIDDTRRQLINDELLNFYDIRALELMSNYIRNRQFSIIGPADVKKEVTEFIEKNKPALKAVPTIEALRAQERKLIQERQKLINQNIREIGEIAPNIAGIERQQAERQMRYEQDYNRERIDALDAEIERLQAEIEAEQLQQQQAMREGERRMGLPAGFIEPMGFGKPKRKSKSKKKMDDDELQITVEVGNKNEASKNLKQMKKIERNLPMAFNDSNDWNYLF